MIEKFLNQIVQGECLELLQQLPDESVDAVITDPPYCSGGRSIAEKSQPPSQKYEQTNNTTVHRPDFVRDTKDQRACLHWCILWINECQRILKPGGYFLMFSDWRQLPTATDALQMGEIRWRGIISWDKGAEAERRTRDIFATNASILHGGQKESVRKLIMQDLFREATSFRSGKQISST